MSSDGQSLDFLVAQFGLVGRTALVTGSTRGIGLAIAQALSAAGAGVIVHGRDAEAAGDVAKSIGAIGVEIADLSNADDVSALRDRIIARDAPLDIVVNNAGLEIGSRVETMKPEDLVRTLSVNLIAPIALVQGLLPALRRSSSASVINISSIHETVPSWGNSAYAASKAALAMVTKTLAIELGA